MSISNCQHVPKPLRDSFCRIYAELSDIVKACMKRSQVAVPHWMMEGTKHNGPAARFKDAISILAIASRSFTWNLTVWHMSARVIITTAYILASLARTQCQDLLLLLLRPLEPAKGKNKVKTRPCQKAAQTVECLRLRVRSIPPFR